MRIPDLGLTAPFRLKGQGALWLVALGGAVIELYWRRIDNPSISHGSLGGFFDFTTLIGFFLGALIVGLLRYRTQLLCLSAFAFLFFGIIAEVLFQKFKIELVYLTPCFAVLSVWRAAWVVSALFAAADLLPRNKSYGLSIIFLGLGLGASMSGSGVFFYLSKEMLNISALALLSMVGLVAVLGIVTVFGKEYARRGAVEFVERAASGIEKTCDDIWASISLASGKIFARHLLLLLGAPLCVVILFVAISTVKIGEQLFWIYPFSMPWMVVSNLSSLLVIGLVLVSDQFGYRRLLKIVLPAALIFGAPLMANASGVLPKAFAESGSILLLVLHTITRALAESVVIISLAWLLDVTSGLQRGAALFLGKALPFAMVIAIQSLHEWVFQENRSLEPLFHPMLFIVLIGAATILVFLSHRWQPPLAKPRERA
jgi:hypothetical protein